ncbi:hypothetical protein Bca101_100909 [Brassica carinata]
MVHRKVAEKSPKSRRDSPGHRTSTQASSCWTKHAVITHSHSDSHPHGRHRGVPTPYIDKTLFFSMSPVDIGCVPGVFLIKLSSKILIFEFLASRVIFATTWVIFATTWVIFATTWVIFATTWVIFAHEDCPWVIFAHEDCPSVHISARWPFPWTIRMILAHDDCPSVRISARWPFPWTVRVIFAHEDSTSHVGPSRGLSVGDFRHRGLSVGDFRLRGLSVGDFRPRGLSVSTHISTLTLPVDCPGDFRPRGLSVSTHISTLALPVDYPWVIFAHEDCPCVIISHEDSPSVRISARWPFPWTVRVIFAHEERTSHVGPSRGLSVGDFRPRGLSVGDFRPRGLSVSTHISTLTLPVDCPGDFRPRGLSLSTHISTLALPVDYPWVIFAHEDCPWVIFAHEDCPWVIFAHDDCPSVRISARWPFPWTVRPTRTVHQYTSQHGGPSRGLSGGDFRPRGLSVGDFSHRGLSVGDFRPRGLSVCTHISSLTLPVDCPGAIRPRGLSVSTHISTLALPVDCPGDFRPRGQYISTHISTVALPGDYPWVIFATRTVRLSASKYISTLTLPVDCPGAFRPRGQYISTHIGTLALPVDCSGDFRPRGLSVSRQLCTDGQSTWTVWVIFAHEDCPLVHISARWPFPWTVSGQLTHVDSPSVHISRSERRFRRTDLANDTCLWEPKLLLRVGNRAAGACVASSPDSDLEAFSHNPAHGSFAPLAFQPSAMTNCANQRFLSRIPLSAPVLSWLFDAGKAPERAAPSPPRPTRGGPLATLAAQAARQQSTGSNWDPEPSPRANPFPGYGSILPTSLAYIVPSTRGCSPWRPAAVMSTTWRERTRSSGFSRARECTDTTRRAVLFQPLDPTSAEPLQGGQAVKQKR